MISIITGDSVEISINITLQTGSQTKRPKSHPLPTPRKNVVLEKREWREHDAGLLLNNRPRVLTAESARPLSKSSPVVVSLRAKKRDQQEKEGQVDSKVTRRNRRRDQPLLNEFPLRAKARVDVISGVLLSRDRQSKRRAFILCASRENGIVPGLEDVLSRGAERGKTRR